MRIEARIFIILTIFFLLVTPIYWFISHEITGAVALTLTFFLCLMLSLFLTLVARRIDERPEDRKDGEIAEGAGELGFFPPRSAWPLLLAGTVVLAVLGPVFGWWLLLLGLGLGGVALTGWVYEFYRGDHAH
ncbi:cytochrome c oxidase subunit 4 [Microlunatus ginsengisoli]|uniref:Cytochrome c oxidase polypeptide 4 n=1 Tax=Microlunatus ginsengisoli TaxID=363863 RepID=A0ABP6ZX98_9ACTN